MRVAWVIAGILVAFSAQAADVSKLSGQPGPPVPLSEARPFLQLICPGQIGVTKGSPWDGLAGCSQCPAFTAFRNERWNVVAVRYGHFTGPNTDEAATATDGCEGHADAFGGTALFVRTQGQWKFRRYERGVITRDCLTVRRRDGRDLLVCEYIDGHMGERELLLYLVDFIGPAAKRKQWLLNVVDNTGACGKNGIDPTPYPLQSARFGEISFDSTTKTLRASVAWGQHPMTKETLKQCMDSPNGVPAALAPRTKTYKLTWEFDGEKSVLSADSLAAKSLIESLPYDP